MDKIGLKKKAFKRLLKGYSKKEISVDLKIPYTTLCRWIKKEEWFNGDDPYFAARSRLILLINKSGKKTKDYTEMEHLKDIVIDFEKSRS